MNNNINRLIEASAIGSATASLLIAVLTIGGEEWAPLKNWLKDTFTHHWLGKSALAILAFVLITALAYFLVKGFRATRALWIAVVCALFSSGAIIFFIILHTLHWI